MKSLTRRAFIESVGAAALAGTVGHNPQAAEHTQLPAEVNLRDGWQIQCAALVEKAEEAISGTGFTLEGWYGVAVPSTVLSALVKNGVYPNPRIGLNAYQMPDSSDEFNQKYDLAKYSHLPDKRNPWREPYWYRNVTEIESTGYDCMMTVPDRNMGICQKVFIDWTGPVDLRNPFIITDLSLPETSRATLAISAELTNVSDLPIKGWLRGQIVGTEVRFAQQVEFASGETRNVTVDPKPVMANPRLWWPVNYGEQHLYDLVLQFERPPGYIQPELLLDWDARRHAKEIRYYADENVNLIYFEDIPNPPDEFSTNVTVRASCSATAFTPVRGLVPAPTTIPLMAKSLARAPSLIIRTTLPCSKRALLTCSSATAIIPAC